MRQGGGMVVNVPLPLDPETLQRPNFQDVLDDGDRSDESICEDHDEVQAVLQPAMSAAASHLTSLRTPAVEKAAALERLPGGGLFDSLPGDDDGDDEDDEDDEDDGGDSTPEPSSPPTEATRPSRKWTVTKNERPDMSLGQLPSNDEPLQPVLPSPWQSRPTKPVIDEPRSQQSRGILESAFGPTRQRSRSAGQEALKRLQKAFPSLSVPSHLIPSLPTSLFSNSTDHKPTSGSSLRPNRTSNMIKQHAALPIRGNPNHSQSQSQQDLSAASTKDGSSTPTGPKRSSGSNTLAPRPPMLRRVTSDDSILYHTLSRSSSLGDDDRFHDVREMVNIRFMAIRDSLPDVPNFRMPSIPSLAKIQAVSRKSSLSLNAMFSSDPSLSSRQTAEREVAASPKAPTTALDRALEELTGDIVILGGYRGSVLRSAEPPHQQVWAPVKVGFNMRKVNLELGLEDEDEENVRERIIPSGMLKHIGPVDISRKLFKKLRSCRNVRSGKLRVWDYGYDWRLSPSRLSQQLQSFLETLPSNQSNQPSESRGALVIAHSLGGVLTRHVVNQRPELFSGVLYAGAPQRCINILGPFRNGDAVLFNEKLLTAAVNFSLRSSFTFLPDDGFCFVDKTTGEEYRLDFFDPEHWARNCLSPCVGTPLPARNRSQPSSPFSSMLPNVLLRPRGDSKSEKRPPTESSSASHSATRAINNGIHKDRTIAPQLRGSTGADARTGIHSDDSVPNSPQESLAPLDLSDSERRRNFEYLGRTLAMIRKFRAELAHSESHQDANVYPPLAVLYGKTIPTVYAVQVDGREGIARTDAYDNLLFRPGDGVVLAKEAMLPEGYSIVRGGRVSTERGHLTMLGDMPAVGRALEALVRGRRKGIGLGDRGFTKDTTVETP